MISEVFESLRKLRKMLDNLEGDLKGQQPQASIVEQIRDLREALDKLNAINMTLPTTRH
jgi:hypothetical protein